MCVLFFFFKQKTAYEMRISDWSSDVCSSGLPEPAAALKALLRSDPRVGVHQRDGYAAIKALLPPAEKRGLVLIDPPYETQQAEFDTVLLALREGLNRWPQGIFALWYPIKRRRTLLPFFRRAAALPIKSAVLAELQEIGRAHV